MSKIQTVTRVAKAILISLFQVGAGVGFILVLFHFFPLLGLIICAFTMLFLFFIGVSVNYDKLKKR